MIARTGECLNETDLLPALRTAAAEYAGRSRHPAAPQRVHLISDGSQGGPMHMVFDCELPGSGGRRVGVRLPPTGGLQRMADAAAGPAVLQECIGMLGANIARDQRLLTLLSSLRKRLLMLEANLQQLGGAAAGNDSPAAKRKREDAAVGDGAHAGAPSQPTASGRPAGSDAAVGTQQPAAAEEESAEIAAVLAAAAARAGSSKGLVRRVGDNGSAAAAPPRSKRGRGR